MARTSIFELEQRFDIDKEFDKIFDDYLQRRDLEIKDGSSYRNGSMMDFINMFMEDFPLAGSSRTYTEFFEERNISLMKTSDKKKTLEFYLYQLELINNFISWTLGDDTPSFDQSCKNQVVLLISKMDLFLEKCNYERINLGYNETYEMKIIKIVKRDADVDSVIPIINPDFMQDVLSYLDFRIENNLVEKENIIKRLYNYLEKEKFILNVDPNKKFFSDTKRVLNYCRHFRENKLSNEEMILLLDKAFYMFLHLIRTPMVKQYLEDTKNLITDKD